jgi:rhomboid protease GluP
MQLGRILIPSLLPLATTGGHRVDYAAHFGGAIVGGAIGALILATWPRERPRPRFAALSVGLAVAAVALWAVSIGSAQQHYRIYRLTVLLAPSEEIAAPNGKTLDGSAELVKRYPRDPRVRFLRALALYEAKDAVGAEAQLRAAIGEQEILETQFVGRTLETSLRTVLAGLLLDGDRGAEAREVARPVCHAGAGGATPDELRALKLCD